MHYQIIPHDPFAHLFRVKCVIDNPNPDGQIVSLPSWIPGSYMLREFAKNIVSLRASSAGQEVAVEKQDKSTWQCAPCQATLEIEYDVYAWDLSVRSAHLDQTHAYFNGTSVFLQVHGKESESYTVEILPPPDSVAADWSVATSLSLDGAELWGFGQYKADDYDDLIDHPVEIGHFDVLSFEAGGVPHDLVLSGHYRADTARIVQDVKKICDTHVEMFGKLPPMARYLFLVWIVGDGYGGLEHRSSTSLLVSRADLPKPGEAEVSDSYRQFLGLCSHEYFHTWNVKRIKPEAFMPYRLNAESYTQQLWAFEGITSYYDDLGLVRSACVDAATYLKALAETTTRVLRGRGRFKQTVAESSFDAWTKFYRQDENAPNAIVSYYTKGSLIALALDLHIREQTNGEQSLDDLMRQLWREYGEPAIGVPEKRIEQMASVLAGVDLTNFFIRYLYGLEDPPLEDLLSSVGVEYFIRPAASVDDKGGTPTEKALETLAVRPDLGLRHKVDNGALRVSHVFEEGAAIQSGIAAGDILIALDGVKLTSANITELLSRYAVGEQVNIHLFRGDLLLVVETVLQSPPADTVELRLMESPSPDQLARRQAWLGQ